MLRKPSRRTRPRQDGVHAFGDNNTPVTGKLSRRWDWKYRRTTGTTTRWCMRARWRSSTTWRTRGAAPWRSWRPWRSRTTTRTWCANSPFKQSRMGGAAFPHNLQSLMLLLGRPCWVAVRFLHRRAQATARAAPLDTFVLLPLTCLCCCVQFYLDDPIGGAHMNCFKAGLILAHRIVAVSHGSVKVETVSYSCHLPLRQVHRCPALLSQLYASSLGVSSLPTASLPSLTGKRVPNSPTPPAGSWLRQLCRRLSQA